MTTHTMRWNCQTDGCYLQKSVLKFEYFTDCFPGKISMSDIDGIVEINGKFLLMEWKNENAVSLPRGQQILFERLVRRAPFVVVVVQGNMETMEVSGFGYYSKQCPTGSDWIDGNLEDLKTRIKAWASHAQGGW